ELVAELDDGLHRIGLRRGGPGVARCHAVCELARSEKAMPSQVLDFRPVEQPVPAPTIDLLIAHAEQTRQDHPCWWQHALHEPRFLLQMVLVVLDLAYQPAIHRE